MGAAAAAAGVDLYVAQGFSPALLDRLQIVDDLCDLRVAQH
jgi:hypothetical protein